MDYEKKYKEALEKARDYWETDNDNTLDIKAKGTMEYLFPELKELEDENIKSCIGMCLTDACEQRFRDYNTSLKDCLAWLEKQDIKTNPYSGVSFKYNGHIWGMCARDNGVDISCDKYLIKHLEKQEQKPIDYKDELKKCRENPLYFFDKYVKLKEKKSTWSEKDEAKLKSACALIRNTSLNRNEGVVDYTIDWLKSLKNRVLPKPADWSEDDKYMIDNLIRIFERNPDEYYKAIRKDMSSEIVPIIFSSEIIDWLKSLKE